MRQVISERNCNLFRRCTGAVLAGQLVRLLLVAVLGQRNPLLLFLHVFQRVLHRALDTARIYSMGCAQTVSDGPAPQSLQKNTSPINGRLLHPKLWPPS